MKMFNPFTMKFMNSEQRIDLKKSGEYRIDDPEDKSHPLILDYDPSRTGTLKDRKSGLPIAVNIVKTTCPFYENQVAYHFMSKDLKKEYGYVQLHKPVIDELSSESELLRDYPEYGIVGDRIIVSYLQNWDDNNVSGVGKLADKMGVKYCIEQGIEPNIVSYADYGSHVAHFKRGKRFIPPGKGSYVSDFLKYTYGKEDPNEILQDLIQDAKWHGTNVDLTGWSYLIMYLPKDVAYGYYINLT